MCNAYVLYSCDNEFYIGIIGKWFRIIGTSDIVCRIIGNSYENRGIE